MASTSSLHSSTIRPFDPFSRTQAIPKPSSYRMVRVRASHDRDSFDGRLVDEDLIVLRKRIHETKMIEANHEPPSEWMDWEKRIYATYDSTICEAMGHLQSGLMETRPCLALGMVALIALSVPTSTAVVVCSLLELIKGVLGGIHIS